MPSIKQVPGLSARLTRVGKELEAFCVPASTKGRWCVVVSLPWEARDVHLAHTGEAVLVQRDDGSFHDYSPYEYAYAFIYGRTPSRAIARARNLRWSLGHKTDTAAARFRARQLVREGD